MEPVIGTILAGLWTAIGAPLIIQGFRWLGSTINRNKAMEGSLIDDKIIASLRTAVSNVGAKTADAIRKNPKEWKKASKEILSEEAKDQALLLLDDKARRRFYDMGDAALDILVRKLVDDREKVKSL